MKGIAPLFLGIFGTFAFSWFGLILIPNVQIGRLDPQTDEEGAEAYPMPKSGMAERGRQVYTANGCVYCHSQQVRPDYAASDIERKWGSRRSAPRDYLFERPALLGKMRMGPDLANVGQRAPADDETAPAPATTGATGAAAPAPGAPTAAGPEPGAVVPPAGAPAAAPPPGATVAAAAPAAGTGAAAVAPAAAAVAAAPPAAAPGGAAPAASPAVASSPAADPKPGERENTTPPTPAGTPAEQIAAGQGAPSPAPATRAETAVATAPMAPPAAAGAPNLEEPLQYSAAWHHRHLYDPRSISLNSTMPSFRYLYKKQRIGSAPSADAVRFAGGGGPPPGWEIVPTQEAKDLVAYLMSLDQSHPLNEVKPPGAAPAAPVAGAAPAAGTGAGQ